MRRPALVCLSVVAFSVAHAQAQTVDHVGGHLGRASFQQTWTLDRETDHRRGWTVGAFVDVRTPKPAISVLVEAGLTRRGGAWEVADLSEILGADAPGAGALSESVETGVTYLTYGVFPTFHTSVGPVGFFGYLGPSLDLVLDTEVDPSLGFIYAEEGTPVFSGVAGAGIGVSVREGWSARLEARAVRNLSVAYEGDLGDMKHRGFELLVRVGKRRD